MLFTFVFVGGAIRTGNFMQKGGNVTIRDSRGSVYGGGISVQKKFMQMGGHLEIHNCNSTYGGAIYAEDSLEQIDGSLSIQECMALRRGGAIAAGLDTFATGKFMQGGGDMLVHHCKAGEGGAFAAKDFMQTSGRQVIHSCQAQQGGAIYAENALQQVGGNMTVRDCVADGGPNLLAEGGAIWAETLTHSGGHLAIQNSKSVTNRRKGSAGGAIFTQSFEHKDGDIRIEKCMATQGGGIHAKMLEHSGGKLSIETCNALEGGAIHTKILALHEGRLSIQGCAAQGLAALDPEIRPSAKNSKAVTIFNQGGGGGIFCDNFRQWGGELWISNCSALRGGGIFDDGVFNQSWGQLYVQSCTASEYGGGLYSKGEVEQLEPARATYDAWLIIGFILMLLLAFGTVLRASGSLVSFLFCMFCLNAAARPSVWKISTWWHTHTHTRLDWTLGTSVPQHEVMSSVFE